MTDSYNLSTMVAMKNNCSHVITDYTKMKQIARKFYQQRQWELSLQAVFIASGFMYTMNQMQYDRELEDLVCEIAAENLVPTGGRAPAGNTIIYYDGLGQIGRGLTYIYMNALVHLGYQVKYITYETNQHVHAVAASIVGEANVWYITGATYLEQMKWLNMLLADSQAHAAFLYMGPDDVVAVGGFSHCPATIKRYLINLTDHAFWLGTNIADMVINFREFGWKVCMERRGFRPEQLLYLPYYPGKIDSEFEGLPFQNSCNKLILSGGALYKTESQDNGYYRLVESILDTISHVNFLYLGDGDTRRLKKLQHRYPGRVAYAPERRDFFEIMKRCTLYLSTYPYNGGLMTQYALLAGKIPVTWVHPGIESELTVCHEESCWNYATLQECLEEVKRLLENDSYRQKREQNLGRFLIGELQFEQELQHILQAGKSVRKPKDGMIAFEGFQILPLENIRGFKYRRLFFRRHGLYMFRFFPLKYVSGMLEAMFQKLSK